MARGTGAIVEDVDGNQFLDCAAGIAVNSTGHSHPDVVAAIVDQAQKFLHMSGTDFYYEPQVRLAEDVQRHRAVQRRQAIVLLEFRHGSDRSGDQAGALRDEALRHDRVSRQLSRPHARLAALTSSKAIQRRGFGPMQAGTFHAPYGNCYRCPVGLEA